MILRSILSPVDFSEHSSDALRWADALARHHGSRLTIVTVIEQLLADAASIQLGQDLPNAETEALRRFVAAETEVLRQFVAAVVPYDTGPSTQITFRAPVGHPVASVILDTAHSEAADLIVMGTHGLGGFRKWLLGSTTERLLRRTDVPVLIVPPTGEPPGVRRADGKLELSRIVAATDFSESSKHAINTAVDIARQFSAKLTLVHVVDPPIVPPQWQPLLEESDEKRIADARTRLDALTDECCDPQACEAIVSVGRPADVIGSLAQDRRAQLIVMGLNSEQGRFAARPGSIAYRVVSSAIMPVLVVPVVDK